MYILLVHKPNPGGLAFSEYPVMPRLIKRYALLMRLLLLNYTLRCYRRIT